jgi:hypothetical protein
MSYLDFSPQQLMATQYQLARSEFQLEEQTGGLRQLGRQLEPGSPQSMRMSAQLASLEAVHQQLARQSDLVDKALGLQLLGQQLTALGVLPTEPGAPLAQPLPFLQTPSAIEPGSPELLSLPANQVAEAPQSVILRSDVGLSLPEANPGSAASPVPLPGC